ncbi:hypothetical protein [Hymenobacter crusticola]|uniref:Uncharacterized protein n=1 Tax=Hymenobacter crusticola TaxID=1770526 RepID=A0A243W604_9BACT|nr:hypothetical protein [Hymenobacter crusticola]OUJ68812.1 hypothetical protein BXP70_27330 [Hymenobacter crusticola]
MLSHDKTQFPSEALFVKDPISGHELDMQPLLKMLHTRYQGDRNELTGDLQEVASYLIHEETECDSARKLRRVLGIVNAMHDAWESITIRKAAR